MKYYQIRLSTEPKIIGVNNGIYQIKLDENAIENFPLYKDFRDIFYSKADRVLELQEKIFNLKIPTINAKLLKKAKVTDIMGYYPSFIFVDNVYSLKYIEVIRSFNIGKIGIFEITIDNILDKYYLMFNETISFSEVDFERSKIITGYKTPNNIEYHSVGNRSEYNEFQQKNPLARFERLSIPSKYYGKDIINVQAAVQPFYSEKLIDFLLDCGITGLEVKYNNSIELDFY